MSKLRTWSDQEGIRIGMDKRCFVFFSRLVWREEFVSLASFCIPCCMIVELEFR
jgi:hypothetical protein